MALPIAMLRTTHCLAVIAAIELPACRQHQKSSGSFRHAAPCSPPRAAVLPAAYLPSVSPASDLQACREWFYYIQDDMMSCKDKLKEQEVVGLPTLAPAPAANPAGAADDQAGSPHCPRECRITLKQVQGFGGNRDREGGTCTEALHFGAHAVCPLTRASALLVLCRGGSACRRSAWTTSATPCPTRTLWRTKAR